MRQFSMILGLMVATLAGQGCTRYMTANNLALVAVSEELPKKKKSAGKIIGKDCATQVFGIGRSPASLTIQNAIDRALESEKFSYLTGFSVDQSFTNIFVYQRNCIEVRGEGFK